MPVTYDQMSEVRIAFHEATVPADRRRSQRVKQRVPAEISPWKDNRAGTAFGVVVEDFSTTGVGIVHSGRLEIGSQYLLEVPRPNQNPLRVIFTAVRCSETDGGLFSALMEPEEIIDMAAQFSAVAEPPRRGRIAILLVVATLFVTSAAAVFLGWV